MSIDQYLVFIPIAIIAIASPGQDFVFVLGASLSKHKLNGIACSIGIGIGNLIWMLLAVFGVSTLFEQSPLLFQLFKYAGASYLLWIGIDVLRSDPNTFNISGNEDDTYFHYFKKGLITNLLNPKCGIFFLAFLPSFVDESQGNIELQMFILGLINTVLAIIIFSVISLSVYQVKHLIEGNQSFLKFQSKLTGIIFVALGLSIPAFDLIEKWGK